MRDYRPGKYVDKAEIQISLEIILKSEKDKKAKKNTQRNIIQVKKIQSK